MSQRLTVGQAFLGWTKLRDLVYNAPDNTKLLILILFKTGCRISEALNLRGINFDLKTSSNSIIIRDVEVSKKWEKGEDGIPIRLKILRAIPVLRSEPLSLDFEDLVKKHINLRPSALIFPQYTNEYRSSTPMSRRNALYMIKSLGDKEGINLSCHFFRGQRASQLVEDYGFDEYYLNKFFSWGSRKPASMAARYAGMDWRGLEKKMLESRLVGIKSE